MVRFRIAAALVLLAALGAGAARWRLPGAGPEPGRRAGFACDRRACVPVAPAGPAPPGLFQTGEIDLTGDGVPETVRRVGEQVVVIDGGVETWRTPAEWRIADVALGDPDDDGRGEMLLAFRKPDAAGTLRSHPFVVGYREGLYRPLWGGSAVVNPIDEVELGDLDGDGVQELIVIEERGGARDVAVWRWHGWGFSQAGRSPPGAWRDLALVPGGERGRLTLSVGGGGRSTLTPGPSP